MSEPKGRDVERVTIDKGAFLEVASGGEAVEAGSLETTALVAAVEQAGSFTSVMKGLSSEQCIAVAQAMLKKRDESLTDVVLQDVYDFQEDHNYLKALVANLLATDQAFFVLNFSDQLKSAGKIDYQDVLLKSIRKPGVGTSAHTNLIEIADNINFWKHQVQEQGDAFDMLAIAREFIKISALDYLFDYNDKFEDIDYIALVDDFINNVPQAKINKVIQGYARMDKDPSFYEAVVNKMIKSEKNEWAQALAVNVATSKRNQHSMPFKIPYDRYQTLFTDANKQAIFSEHNR